MSSTLLTREENRADNLEEYRNKRTVLKSLPQFLVVELTQGCNLACPMCRSKNIHPTSRRMQADLFEQIADELFSTAWMIDLRGWGESLVLPEIEDRIRRAALAHLDELVVVKIETHKTIINETPIISAIGTVRYINRSYLEVTIPED